MKILHSADWHLGAYVGPQCDSPMKRMENTMRCLDKLVETARAERPDIILVAGDILHQARVWAERSMIEVQIAARYLNILGGIAPTFVLAGTLNHDGTEQLKTIDLMTDIAVRFMFTPEMLEVNTKSGSIQIAGLPGFDKGHFRAQFPGLSAEEENKVFTEQLAGIVAGLSAQVDPSMPSVLMAHHTVVGCELDNGQHVFQTNEVVLPAAALDSSNFDLVCLGHIHKRQWLKYTRVPTYYSGSIDAFTFNDEEHEKGFYIHEIISKNEISSSFIDTPSREFVTLKMDDKDLNYSIKTGLSYSEETVKDKVVRVLYICDTETEKALNKKKLEQDLYAAGAYYVSEIRPEKVTASVNQKTFHEKMTVESCLQRYLEEKNKSSEEIVQLLDVASNIIAKAQASMPLGTSSGLFLPVEISVRNYRSYAEETFNFEDILFAMVNGKNGSGKSSLFMDAITDCLFERTRENELTGWIRNGEKSGSISFTFRLGEDLWRVTRTRQRSGKGTLALAKYVWEEPSNGIERDEYWQDHSSERMADTQQKIIDILGMDCDTFQSCVLIMQDQYGKFMEADKSERMAVLANLLGLGIYDELLTITKEQLTDLNREVRTVKEEIQALEDEIADEDNLCTELQHAEASLRLTQDDLKEQKEKLNDLQAKIGAIDGYEQEAARLQNELRVNTQSYTDKKAKRDDLQKRVEETKSFLENEQTILDKCTEFENAKLEIAALEGKLQLLGDKNIRKNKLNQELIETRRARQVALDKITNIESQMEEREELQHIVESLSDAEEVFEEYEIKEKDYQIFDARKQTVVYEKKSLEKQIEMLKDSDCIDVERAQCKFLKSAKEAKDRLIVLENELVDLNKALGEIGYDANERERLIKDVKTYRVAKDKLAALSADVAIAEQLKIQEQESLKKIEEIQSELDTLSQGIETLSKETSRVSELKQKVETLTRYSLLKDQIPQAKQFIESTETTIAQLNSDIEGLTQQIQQINTRLNELSLLTVDKGKLHNHKQSIEKEITNLETLISRLNQSIGSINAELKTIAGKKEQVKGKQEKLHQSVKQAAQLQVLAEAFSQDGIPYQIVRDIVPELEAAANEILSQMTGGRMRLEFVTEKTLKSNKAKEVATLDIIINDVDNGVLPYLSRSGGQKVRAALAVSFALAMVKASRVGLQLGMMFVDEPPFLDAEGAEAYCTALAAIHDRYPEMRILAISHDENMKTKFPQQIQIEVTNEGSKVRR